MLHKIFLLFLNICFTAFTSSAQTVPVFKDTMDGIVTDSFIHHLGSVADTDLVFTQSFGYIGSDTVYILRIWSSDPGYICSYPTGCLLRRKVYHLKACFPFGGKQGLFRQTMGFELSNGKRISFVFDGNVATGYPKN